MKKLLLLLSLLTPITGLGASGGGKIDASYIEAVRQGSAPSSPASGKARAYVLDSDGKFYVKNSAGTAKACTYSGDVVNADLSGSAGITNANLASMSQNTFKCRTTASTGAPEDCTAAQGQAIVGSVPQLLTHQSTPSSPSAGSVYVYAKSDNNLYIKDSGGTETKIVAGGTITGFATISGGDTSGTYGSYSCQVFTTTGDRTLTVTTAGPVMFAMVGGGGGGAWSGGGGGGIIDHYWEDIWLQAGSYTVHVGAGGAAGTGAGTRGTTGESTTFAGFTAAGGGGGATFGDATTCLGRDGGGGGGGGWNSGGGSACNGGAGTFWKPEVQGYAGGNGSLSSCHNSSGGGGAGALGSNGSSCNGGAGGAGQRVRVAELISGTATYWGGGGGGGLNNSGGSCVGSGGAGGTGGGATGANGGASAGTANTGGGGGGGCSANGSAGSAGGSGKAIVCARVAGS